MGAITQGFGFASSGVKAWVAERWGDCLDAENWRSCSMVTTPPRLGARFWRALATGQGTKRSGYFGLQLLTARASSRDLMAVRRNQSVGNCPHLTLYEDFSRCLQLLLNGLLESSRCGTGFVFDP